MPDYIPAKDADYAAWLANFSTRLTAAPAAVGLLPADAVLVASQNSAYQAAYLAASTPATRTAATVATARGARITSESTVRPYAMRINANQSVSDAQRTDYGLTVRSDSPTPIPAPATSPALILVGITPGRHELQYRDASSPDRKAKPTGAIQLEVFRGVGAGPVARDACQYLAAVTKSPVSLSTADVPAGQQATYYARWTTRGGPSGIAQPGPWSNPLTAVCA